MTSLNPSAYARAGVDTEAGDLAVELMKKSVLETHGENVPEGIGGFAGLYDASWLKNYERPLLATATDGVGTKLAIAQALDRHDTIGQDLVAMIADDLVVTGAKPLFMTDYIACGRLVPERIAQIVSGVALACRETGMALLGGETAEHPGVMEPADYDIAGAATGVVEAGELLGAARVRDGDAVLAVASNGLHSNGFSLVRSVLRDAGVQYSDYSAELGASYGEVLLTPTMLYTTPFLALLEGLPGVVHAFSHVTGGGVAANLSRVLPAGCSVSIDRGGLRVPAVIAHLAALGGMDLRQLEGTWNMGVGMFAVVSAGSVNAVCSFLGARGCSAWFVGEVRQGAGGVDVSQGADVAVVRGAKGVSGGAVSMCGGYR